MDEETPGLQKDSDFFLPMRKIQRFVGSDLTSNLQTIFSGYGPLPWFPEEIPQTGFLPANE